MKKPFKLLLTLLPTLALVAACQKEGGASRKTGSGRNDVDTKTKLMNEDLYQKNQELFKTCQNTKVEDIASAEGFSKNTLAGKNLELILNELTGQNDFKSSLDQLEKDNKQFFSLISNRLELIKELLHLENDLKPKEKFLVFEGVADELFPFGDKALSKEEVTKEVESLSRQANEKDSMLAKGQDATHQLMELVDAAKDEKVGTNAVEQSKKQLDEKIKKLSTAQSEKLESKKSKVKTIVTRLQQKDKKLTNEYKNLSVELVNTSGSLEKKACSQMVFEKTGKDGDLLNLYLQTIKARIDLEAYSEAKPEKRNKG